MGIPVKRRQLITNLFRSGKIATGDVAFKKFANKKLPANLPRINSGLAAYTGTFGENEALHLLRRVTFGATKAHVDLIKNMTASVAVDYLIDNPVLPASTPLNSYESVYHDTQNCPAGSSWVSHSAPFNDDFSLTYFRTYWSLKPWWFNEMINQPPHILEKISLFWDNHFSTQANDQNYSKAVWQHFKTIRTHSLGNFKTLIKEITIDPHMLVFLNGTYNNRYSPDENYARELQELFTVGKGLGTAGYTEGDVQAAARVLTGWRRKDNPDGSYGYYFQDDWHEPANKQFSSFYNNTVITGRAGAAGAAETDDLLTMIFATQEVAKYVCRRLYRWFIYYVIDDATEANVITPLATIFRNSNYDIKPVLKALFKSEHFFDPLNAGCIIKSPADLYAGMVREFKIQLPNSPLELKYGNLRHFIEQMDNADQSLADPPNVAGWRAYYQDPVYYEAWINSDTIQKRAKAINDYSRDGIYSYSTKIKIDSIEYNKLFSNPSNPNEVISNFIKYLLPKDLSANQKDYMKSILLSNQLGDYYWTNAWNNYIGTPTPDNEMIVRFRLDTLINYITSLEEYQLC